MKMMTAFLFAILLLTLAGGAFAGESLSPEKSLPLHEGRDAFTPCAAFAKGGYIVAWQSGKLAPGDLREGFNFCGDIVGCRVDESGKARDAQPFVICKADDLQEAPRAAAGSLTGSGQGKDMVLVVWQDLRNKKDWDVYAARVSADGKVLDADGFLVSGGAHNQARPDVAWDGKTFVVVWQDFRGGKMYEVHAARVSAEGKVLEPQGIALSKQGGSCYDPTIASKGDGKSLVYWSVASRPLGIKVDAQSEGLFLEGGKPSAPFFKQNRKEGNHKAQPGWGNTPPFACAGKNTYLLAWRNEHPVGRGNGDTGANAYLFNAQGKRGTKLTLGGYKHRVLNADMAWDGSAFVAAWTEYRTKDTRVYKAYEHVFASRIGADGKLLGKAQLVAGSSTSPERWKYGMCQLGRSAAGRPESPATNACVASNGEGTTLVAYEKHPMKAEMPVEIAFRLLRAK